MKKGKSNYSFVVNADVQSIHNLVQSFLGTNGFNAKCENGFTYYLQQDFMWGNRFFEYYVNGNQVTILAYIGTFKKPLLLDDSFAGSMPKQEYKKLLATLFNALNELNTAGVQMNAGAQMNAGVQQDMYATYQQQDPYASGNMGAQPQYVDISQQTNQFAENVNSSKEKMAVAGFVIAVIGIVLSCFGFSFGWLIIALEIYFAINGLKTSKKGLAIATLVLSGISILILVVQIVLIAMS